MISRREFLAALAVSPALARALTTGTDTLTSSTGAADAAGEWVNDVQSALNRTRVAEILRPTSVEEVVKAVVRARETKRGLSICGTRHAMGTQQFGTDTILLDMTALNKISPMVMGSPRADMQAGATWPQLVAHMRGGHKSLLTRPPAQEWAVCQKQTGADELTIGGSVASNIHGRGQALCPLSADIESLELVDAEGAVRRIDRGISYDLFRLVLGGYGLFGIVTSVGLRLTRLMMLRRHVALIAADQIVREVEERLAANHMYGDFHCDIDPASDGFLTNGILVTYERLFPGPPEIPAGQTTLTPADWQQIALLAHTDKAAAYQRCVSHYLTTHEQLYWSDLHQLGAGLTPGYHEQIDRETRAASPGSDVIGEMFVPRGRLAEYPAALAEAFRKSRANVIGGTVRLIIQDQETFLPWARQSYACVAVSLHVEHTPDAIARARDDYRTAIDLALERDGSFYLTYHKWATREQVLKAYPQFPEFPDLKRKHDPDGVFQSDWFRHHATLVDGAA